MADRERSGDDGDDGDELITRVAETLRAPEQLDSTFWSRFASALVVEASGTRLAGAHVDGTHTRWGWWLRPRLVRLSPAMGVALAAGIGAIAFLGARYYAQRALGAIQTGPVSASAVVRPGATPVQFVLAATAARRVTLVGDFNDWNAEATPLVPATASATDGARLWSVVVPLAPGRHQYAFIVDGTRWVTDPSSPAAVDPDFGKPNSTLTVGEPSA
jgi:Glycogen recognition site of AMP-activated protein kinase